MLVEAIIERRIVKNRLHVSAEWMTRSVNTAFGYLWK